MPIVNQTLQTTTQADGSTYNILRLYDQDAREYMQTWTAPDGFDNAAKAQLVKTDIEEQLKIDEFEALVAGG